jgi:signal peptidase I
MNIVLWGIFYVILTGILLYFFIKEKVIVEWLKGKEKNIAEKLTSKGDLGKMKKTADILTVVHIIILALLFWKIMESGQDLDFAFKKNIIMVVFALNAGVLILRKKQEWAFVVNALLLVLGRLMMDMQGIYLYTYLAVGCVLFLLEIYLYQNQIFEAVHLIETSVTAVVIVLLIQNFYLGNFMIPTGSMRPTIIENDRFFANMISYKFKKPQRGDIIAFKEPKENKLLYTKRLVGLPGETLSIDDSGELVINDKVVEMKAHLIGQGKKELTVTNEGLVVIKNNGYDRETGEVYNEVINFKTNLEGNEGASIQVDKKGDLSYDGQMLDTKVFYRQEGFLGFANKVYIPKKGDIVTLGKIYKMIIEREVSTQSYVINYVEVPLEEVTGKINSGGKYTEVFYNTDGFRMSGEMYLYSLNVKGRDETVMNILDFRYDKNIMEQLLAGQEITLKHDYYFAMGDNSSDSDDSRYWGYVQDSRIKGRLLFRFLPITKFGVVK